MKTLFVHFQDSHFPDDPWGMYSIIGSAGTKAVAAQLKDPDRYTKDFAVFLERKLGL